MLLALPFLSEAQNGRKKQGSKSKTTTQSSRKKSGSSKQAGSTKGKSKEQLEREKRDNLRKMQETTRILAQTKAQREASLGQLNAIKEKITVQDGIITTISSEIKYLDRDLNETETVVESLNQDLEELKREYAAMVYMAYKNRNSAHQLMFLFSSGSFNQLIRRMQYMRQYSEARHNQVKQIQMVQQTLNDQLNGLTRKKQQKQGLLTEEVVENRSLLQMKSEKDQMITQLSRKEQQLQQQLKEQQQAVRTLERTINRLVQEEMARAAARAREEEAARAKAAAAGKAPAAGTKPDSKSTDKEDEDAPAAKSSSSGNLAVTPETALLSSNFAGNKGRLPWPVQQGFIAQRFGRHPHAVLRNVTVENLGIDIQTVQGAPVRAVFDGKVVTSTYIQGMGNVVMIQHGQYFTVYGNLRSVSVSPGQKVKAKDTLGTVSTDSDNASLLKFFIWKGNAKLNPESWLTRK